MNPESGSCGIMQIIEPTWDTFAAQIMAVSAAVRQQAVAATGMRWALQGLIECYNQPLCIDLGGGYFAVPR
jgi:hypothetical protein